MTFTPVLKHYLWGGRNLEKLGRTCRRTAWSPEPGDRRPRGGAAVVDNGLYAGWPLPKVQAELGLDLVGRANAWAQAGPSSRS